jgi:hypothetical protein
MWQQMSPQPPQGMTKRARFDGDWSARDACSQTDHFGASDCFLPEVIAFCLSPSLTHNSCRHSDGWSVTLKFADAVGEVLISGPAISNAPLAFKHYI